MADRSILVRLGLNVDDFNRGARSAASSLEEVAKKGDKTGQVAATGLGRMEQSARLQSAEWNQVGGQLLRVGGAVTAVNAAVAVTGVRYNMLQQTSRAALSTLMGGAAQAAAQMDRLDDFAKTSPFAKDTFIKAQQQMLAFGIESKKVIPYLDAIQNAVAAAGGSNTELAGIVTIMAKIKSSAKITATDLMEFGNYGLDAATLIGSAMGKTGAQIREEITAGTLDAGQALDALASGMQKRFGGAAANVKETLAGAFDRVKAAWRDLSSDLMSPMVGKNGGGIFVTLLNQAADLMRMVQKLPEPVKQVGFALSTTGGFALLAAGGFMKLVPGMLETHRAMTTLGQSGVPIISKMAASFASVGPSLGKMVTSATGGFSEMLSWMRAAETVGLSRLEGLAVGGNAALKGLGGSAKAAGNALVGAFGGAATMGVTLALAGITAAIMNYSQKAQAAKQASKEYADALDKITGAATAANREILANQALDGAGRSAWKAQGQDLNEYLNLLVTDLPAAKRTLDAAEKDLMTRGVTPWSEGGKVWGDMKRMYDQAADGVERLADESEIAAGAADELTGSLAGTAGSAQAAADAEQEAADAAKAVQEAYEMQLDALKAVNDYRDRMSSAANAALAAERDWINSQKELNEQIEKNGTTLDQNTEAGQKNMKAWQDLVSAGVEYVSTSVQAGESSEISAAKFAEADAAISGFADQLGITSEEALEAAHRLGWLTDQDYDLLLSMYVEGENDVAAAEDQLQGIPRETWAKITAETNAPEIVDTVNQALALGIPAETITEIFAENETQAAAAEAEQMVNDVRQRKAARIEAVNAANPEIAQAQKSMDSFQQKTPPAVKVNDQASGILSSIKWGIDRLTDKQVTITTKHITTGTIATGGMVATPKAMGGAITGAGSGTSDDIPIWASNGEHMVTAFETLKMGGHQNLEYARALMRSGQLKEILGLANGGAVSHSVTVPSSPTVRSVPIPGQQVVNNTYSLRVDADVSKLRRLRDFDDFLDLFPQLAELNS